MSNARLSIPCHALFVALPFLALTARAGESVPTIQPNWIAPQAGEAGESEEIRTIDARPGVGILIDTLAHLASYTPDGDLRWRACVECSDDWIVSTWGTAALTEDGGAWAVRWGRLADAEPADFSTRIERYGAAGALLFDPESVVDATGAAAPEAIRLLPTPTDAVMLVARHYALDWQRIDAAGTTITASTHVMPDDEFAIADARRMSDGGTLVLAKGNGYCSVGCPPFYVTVLRLAADGSEAWRYQFPEASAPSIPAALGAQGDAVALLPGTGDGAMQVRVVHADGSVAADVPLQDVPANSYAEWIRPAADGSWRVQTYSRDDGTEDLWRFEDDGSATSSRSGRGLYSPQISPFGLLAQYPLDANGSMGLALLDADTLADTAEFEVWTGRPIGLNPWLILDDGTVYGTIQRSPDGPEAIARYSAPGAAPSNVVFRDAFD